MIKVSVSNTKNVWPTGSQNLFFRRTTDRYAKKGTISSNKGYLRVKRNSETGRFVKI